MTSGTRAHGYFFCDHCEELASGPRCEHCSRSEPTVRWVQMPQRAAAPQRSGPRPVNAARGRELFAQIFQRIQAV